MGLWIKDSELEVFRIEGVDARFYLKRISRGALLKAQEVALASVDVSNIKPSKEQREVAAWQKAQHDAKPLEERLEAELDDAYAQHDRTVMLDFGLPKVESWTEPDESDLKVREGENWLEILDPTYCEIVFRELIRRNAVLPSRLKA